jgi:hypothetical protein
MLRYIIIFAGGCLAVGCARGGPSANICDAERQRPPAATATTRYSSPTTADLLIGTYRGEVFDGEDHNPVTTAFSRDDATGELRGGYTLRERDGTAVTGTLGKFNDIWPEMCVGQFTWSDQYGTGLLSMFVEPVDGSSFRGIWGDDGTADPRMKWTGKRVDAATKPTTKRAMPR